MAKAIYKGSVISGSSDFYLMRRNSQAYTQGAVVFSENLPSPLVLECTTPGTTGSSEPSYTDAAEGDTVTDGTVEWTYRSILSGSGGGAMNVVQLTQAQYDLLTPEQKADTTKLYMITDQDPSGSGSSGGGLNLREPSKAYAVGDIAYSALLPSWARLECVTAGTTASTDITVPTPTTAGQYITDGTVKWIIDDIRDGDRVGDVVLHSALLPCHILADGAILADVSTEYPRLLATVIAENMVTSDSTDMGKYYYDSGADTLRVPKADDGRFIEGSTAAGTARKAGLPNITGTVADIVALDGVKGSGAFSIVRYGSSASINGNRQQTTIYFSARNSSSIYGASNTVQPKSLTSIAQIKY